MSELTNNEINKFIHTQILGNCIHVNASRNTVDPLLIACADCGNTLTPREYWDENWECRHSEKEPQFGTVRVCKYCGADDVSFVPGIRERPDYCSDLNLTAKAEAKVDKRKYIPALAEVCGVRLAEHCEPYADATFEKNSLYKLATASPKDRRIQRREAGQSGQGQELAGRQDA